MIVIEEWSSRCRQVNCVLRFLKSKDVVLQAFDVKDKLRAHKLHRGKSIINVHQCAGWGVRGASVVVKKARSENEVQDVSVILAAETAMLVNCGSSLE